MIARRLDDLRVSHLARAALLGAAGLVASACGSHAPASGSASNAPAPADPSPGAPDPAAPPAAGGSYDPCAGKSCGDACTICSPSATDCVETMEVKQCDGAGKCSSAPAECPR